MISEVEPQLVRLEIAEDALDRVGAEVTGRIDPGPDREIAVHHSEVTGRFGAEERHRLIAAVEAQGAAKETVGVHRRAIFQIAEEFDNSAMRSHTEAQSGVVDVGGGAELVVLKIQADSRVWQVRVGIYL